MTSLVRFPLWCGWIVLSLWNITRAFGCSAPTAIFIYLWSAMGFFKMVLGRFKNKRWCRRLYISRASHSLIIFLRFLRLWWSSGHLRTWLYSCVTPFSPVQLLLWPLAWVKFCLLYLLTSFPVLCLHLLLISFLQKIVQLTVSCKPLFPSKGKMLQID